MRTNTSEKSKTLKVSSISDGNNRKRNILLWDFLVRRVVKQILIVKTRHSEKNTKQLSALILVLCELAWLPLCNRRGSFVAFVVLRRKGKNHRLRTMRDLSEF